MVPTTITGLVLLLVLFIPGFAYLVGRERNGPERKLSGGRWVVGIVFGGMISQMVALLLLTPLWASLLDERRLLTDSLKYWGEEPFRVLWTALACLVVATLLAYVASLPRSRRAVNTLLFRLTPKKFRTELPAQVHPSTASAWWQLFVEIPEDARTRYKVDNVLTTVCCVLDTGIWIEGDIAAFNPSSEDYGDRDLLLQAPIRRLRAAACARFER